MISHPRWRQHIAIYGFFLLIVITVTYPVISELGTVFIGNEGSDAFEYAHHIWWYRYALQNGEPLFHHTLLAYPDGISAWWLWAIPLQAFPAVLFNLIMPLPVAYNLMMLLRLTANGWAMAFLVQRLLDGTHNDKVSDNPIPLALVAGTTFMLYPTLQGHLYASHVGILALWGVPLLLDSLLRLRKRTRILDYVWCGVCLVISPLGSQTSLFYVVMPLVAVMLIARLINREYAWFWRCVLGIFIGGLILSFFAVPALIEQYTTAATIRPEGQVYFGAPLLSIFAPSSFHPLYDDLAFNRTILGREFVETSAYIGIVGLVLCAIAVAKLRTARLWFWAGITSWILALGPILKFSAVDGFPFTVENFPTFFTLPNLLLANLPIFNILRTPGRFNLATAITVAVLVGYGLAWVSSKLPKNPIIHWAVALSLTVVIALDYQLYWDGWQPTAPTTWTEIPESIVALHNDERIRAIFNIPYGGTASKRGMYLQIGHQKPIIAGQISRETPIHIAKLNLMQNTLDATLLNEAGVDVVILHKGIDVSVTENTFARLGIPFYEDEHIAAFYAPETDQPASFLALPINPTVSQPNIDTHIFVPETGWAMLRGELQLSSGFELAIKRESQPIQYFSSEDGRHTLDSPIPVLSGYQTVTVGYPISCPGAFLHDEILCKSLRSDNFTVSNFVPSTITESVVFTDGITLPGVYVPPEVTAGDNLDVSLWWVFENGLTDSTVRFVHLIDENNQQIVGDDTALGEFAARAQQVDTLTLTIPPETPTGHYSVYVGWYTYPDLNRLGILSGAGEEAVNNWVKVATVNIAQGADS